MHGIRACTVLTLVLDPLIAWAEAVQGCNTAREPSQRVTV